MKKLIFQSNLEYINLKEIYQNGILEKSLYYNQKIFLIGHYDKRIQYSKTTFNTNL